MILMRIRFFGIEHENFENDINLPFEQIMQMMAL
jgi:hypothetical protein